jgi:hypothetical protein
MSDIIFFLIISKLDAAFFSLKTTLSFCMTAHTESTKSGTPYIMKYTDDFGNFCSRTIDSHNQSRQANLA